MNAELLRERCHFRNCAVNRLVAAEKPPKQLPILFRVALPNDVIRKAQIGLEVFALVLCRHRANCVRHIERIVLIVADGKVGNGIHPFVQRRMILTAALHIPVSLPCRQIDGAVAAALQRLRLDASAEQHAQGSQ